MSTAILWILAFAVAELIEPPWPHGPKRAISGGLQLALLIILAWEAVAWLIK